MTIPIPDQCSKCTGDDIRPQGDRYAMCMDCGAVFEFMGVADVDNDGGPEVVIVPRNAKLAGFSVGHLSEDVCDSIMAGKIVAVSIGNKAHLEAKPCLVHIVDENQCVGEIPDTDPATAKLAHQVYEVWPWIRWVSVQRTGDRFVVKIKHDYPVDIRADLRRWLSAHEYTKKWAATFELQVRKLEPAT